MAGGVGAHLLTGETLDRVRRRPWRRGREEILDLGMRWYDGHPVEVERVAANLEHFGFPRDGAFLDEVLRGIVIHYFEKLFVLVKGYEAFWIAGNRVELGDSLDAFREARETKRAVFAGQSHFGATYLMASVLMVGGIDVNCVGNFPEPVGGMLAANVATLAEKYGTARARLLNLADKGVDVPTEMITALLGRKVKGGTGMDRILQRFGDDDCVVLTHFLVRTSDETFRYEVDRHSLAEGDIVESFFRSYERRIREHPEQWYFIHEVHENFVD